MPDLDEQAVSPFASTAASLPIDRLVRDASPDYGVDTDKMKTDLTKVTRQKSEATDTAVDRQLAAQTSNYNDLKAKAAAVTPLNVKPWNADQERADRIRSPLEDFGSYGSVFAMLASALTRTPMDNALNAGAAAINFARANDFDSYEKAHQAHKENLDLALKVHESERQAFKDAEELYKSDPVAGGAELRAVAARFGAKAELAMIDSGYVDQVFKVQNAKAEAADKLIKTIPDLNKMDEQARVTMMSKRAVDEENQKRKESGQPPLTSVEQSAIAGEVRRNLTQSFGAFSTTKVDELAIEKRAAEIVKNDPSIPIWDARLQAKGELKDATASPASRELADSIAKGKDEWNAAHPEAGGVIPASVENEIRAKAKGSYSTRMQESAAIEARAKSLMDRDQSIGSDRAYSEAARQITQEKSVLSANQRDKLMSHVDQIDESVKSIDNIEKTIEKYVGAVGLPSRALRVKERVSNILGSNETDRVQMLRDLERVRMNATRLLTDSSARPLAAEASRINTIIPGTELGDTAANTLRALEEIKGLYTRMKGTTMSRINGTWQPEGAGAAPATGASSAAPARTSRNPWDNDPVIK